MRYLPSTPYDAALIRILFAVQKAQRAEGLGLWQGAPLLREGEMGQERLDLRLG